MEEEQQALVALDRTPAMIPTTGAEGLCTHALQPSQ